MSCETALIWVLTLNPGSQLFLLAPISPDLWFSIRSDLVPQEAFLISMTAGVLPASCGPRMLLNILQQTRRAAPTTISYPAQNVNNAKAENPCAVFNLCISYLQSTWDVTHTHCFFPLSWFFFLCCVLWYDVIAQLKSILLGRSNFSVFWISMKLLLFDPVQYVCYICLIHLWIYGLALCLPNRWSNHKLSVLKLNLWYHYFYSQIQFSFSSLTSLKLGF